MGIRDHERELCTGMPTVGRPLGVGVIEIHRDGVVGRCVGVSKGEEQYPPVNRRWKDEAYRQQQVAIIHTIYDRHIQTPD